MSFVKIDTGPLTQTGTVSANGKTAVGRTYRLDREIEPEFKWKPKFNHFSTIQR